jgi:hypothetical protein
LSEFEHTNYSSNRELLDEMVRQRLTQDYQLVPPSHVNVETATYAQDFRQFRAAHNFEGISLAISTTVPI